MKTILVVANETLGGSALLEKVRSKVEDASGDARVVICVPRSNPKHGNVIYDDFVFQAAQVRIDLARQFLREQGIEAIGEIGDPDPYSATMDAVGEHHPDEIVISTYPESGSGWLRRDLIGRVEEASGLPVEHVVVDVESEGLPFKVTLVVANRTAASDQLLECLRRHAEGDATEHLFIALVPQEGGDGLAARKAAARLAQVQDRIRAAGYLCAGLVGDPDPYTAIRNALQYFRVDDIIISTLPATRSGWLRADLIQRVEKSTGKPVEHVEVQSAPTPAA